MPPSRLGTRWGKQAKYDYDRKTLYVNKQLIFTFKHRIQLVFLPQTAKYELSEIVKGDSIFCATGITSSNVMSGIKIEDEKYTSETLVTHKSSGLKKVIKTVNPLKE